MEMVFLNKSGHEKFLSYLKEALGSDKLELHDDCLKVVGEDIQLQILIPAKEIISELTQPAGEVGTGVDPAQATPAVSVGGRETGVQKLGRANKEREAESSLTAQIELLKKTFPTRDEVQKTIDKLKKKSVAPTELQGAFSKIGDTLGRK